MSKAGITGRTFHDLRGTFITRARWSGATIKEICRASGHVIKSAEAILEAHHLATDLNASDAVILKIEVTVK